MIRLVVCAFLVVVVAVGPARAQPSDEQLTEAKEQFARGERHYAVGEFGAAVEAYGEAYRLSQASGLLFNIAQAHRLAGNAERALYFYRSYLRAQPTASNRADVDRLIAVLETQLREERERKDSEQRAAERQRQIELSRLESAQRERRSRRTLRVAGIASASAGVLALGAGTFFLLSSRSKWQDINDHAAAGGRWSPELADEYDSAETREVLSTVFFATGGAALVTGGLMYYFGRERNREVPATVVPTRQGIALGGRF